jgi:hypothetical protein
VTIVLSATIVREAEAMDDNYTFLDVNGGQNRSNGSTKITGCYSNLYFNEEGEDLLGYEFVIVNSKNGYYILYQESEGAPTKLYLLPANVKGNEINFTVPSQYPKLGPFHGVITTNGLVGKFHNMDHNIILKRKNSYWVDNTPLQRRTGLYSNMHYDPVVEGVFGYEFFIILSKNDYFVIYQESSVEIEAPILCPVKFNGSEIEFIVPSTKFGYRQFKGLITTDGLTGRFNSNAGHIKLLRKTSYWQ